MSAYVRDFAASTGQWAGIEAMALKGLNARERYELHTFAASLGLFTQSTGKLETRVFNVYRNKPVGWVKNVPKPKMTNKELRQFMPELFTDDLWAGGGRDFIGDCANCGVELWGYENDRNEDEDDELLCMRCGGETLSKWELMR